MSLIKLPRPLFRVNFGSYHLHLKAKFSHRFGSREKAIRLLEKLADAHPQNVLFLKDLARVRYSIQDDRGVIEALDRVREIKRFSNRTTRLYAKSKLRNVRQEVKSLRFSGDNETASALLEDALEEFPQDAALLKDLAHVRYNLQDDCGAIEALDRVSAIEPLGDHASELYARAKRLSAENQAKSLRRSGKHEKASELLEKLLEEDPQNIPLLKDLANSRFILQDDRGVIDALDRVLAIEPLGPHTAELYSRASLRLGRRELQKVHYYIDIEAPHRLPMEEMIEMLAPHDVISFDIFDTAIVRAVAEPNHVFRLMGSMLSETDFTKKRKLAEQHARTWKNRIKGTREVTLDEIYEVFADQHGATDHWKQLEKDLEVQLTRQNPYVFQVYERLRAMGKTLIFTSDMYLPKETLETMLARAGYGGHKKIYLSNEHAARKGDGTLQRILKADYGSNCSIAHVGDVYAADVRKSIEAGIAGVHNPNQFSLVREKDMSNLAGSVYEAVINNALGTGTWSEELHYTHGFRVGGILTLGFVEFLERLAKEKGIDKILFFGRDCDVISQVYRRFFDTLSSAYIDTSRAASLMLTADKNFDDYIHRTFFRWYNESNNSRPLSQLLVDSGFDYLVSHLENSDIEPLQFPASADEERLRDFLWAKKSVIEEHLAETRAIAHEYFATAIGDARKVLAVDIGWSGTCISTLRDFLRSGLGEAAPQIFGALLATSRNEQITDAVSDGSISAFIYSPVMNQDITRLMMPAGSISRKRRDLLTHPVEYLFTEPKGTTITYAHDSAGKAVAVRGANVPRNSDQILEMQRGILDFVEKYLEYSKGFEHLRKIGPYTAFQPLRNALGHRRYLYEVYKDFIYDAVSVMHNDILNFERFGDLLAPAFEDATIDLNETADQSVPTVELRPRILFVSPEMKYVGAPRSLLRLCKVAANLGYEPIVWTARSGPFSREFEAFGIPVQTVRESVIDNNKINELIDDNVKLVVCNTVVTDGYVRGFEGRLPVVWYVREAQNVPQFLRGNRKREKTLRKSSSVIVVSDYAAQAVREFAEGPIEVVENAVEDVSDLALPYVPARDGVVRFVQLGTIEHRKGFDVFVAAYKAMPETYRARAELHFAGGFINSGTSFASYVFGQISDEPGIHYHGLIDNERNKIELLSQMDVVVVGSRDESCSLVALGDRLISSQPDAN